MTVWIVEFDHKHGTEIWAAKSGEIANAIVKSIQKHIFGERDPDDDWTLTEAMEAWDEYSGNTEFFRINEISLIDTVEAAKKARA